MAMRIVGRERRKLRIRRKISGTPVRLGYGVPEREAHLRPGVDDVAGKTLAHASTLSKTWKPPRTTRPRATPPKKVGATIAKTPPREGDRQGRLRSEWLPLPRPRPRPRRRRSRSRPQVLVVMAPIGHSGPRHPGEEPWLSNRSMTRSSKSASFTSTASPRSSRAAGVSPSPRSSSWATSRATSASVLARRTRCPRPSAKGMIRRARTSSACPSTA